MEQYPEIGTPHERFRYVRERAGLSREALSAELKLRRSRNTSVMTIRRFEAGEKPLTLDIVGVLSDLAGNEAASWIVSGVVTGGATPEFQGAPLDGIQIIGHIEAELMRREEGEEGGGAHEAFEVVERRVIRLRRESRLTDAGWVYWLALRRGAVLAGGYRPETSDLQDPGADSSAQSIA